MRIILILVGCLGALYTAFAVIQFLRALTSSNARTA